MRLVICLQHVSFELNVSMAKYISISNELGILPEKASAVPAKGERFKVVEDKFMVLDLHHLPLTHSIASLWSSRPHRVQRHDLRRRSRGRSFL